MLKKYLPNTLLNICMQFEKQYRKDIDYNAKRIYNLM